MGVADTSLALMVMMGAKTRALKAFTEPEYVMYIAVSSRCAIYMTCQTKCKNEKAH